ncbi:YraN family protein [Clostridium tertium]|uniref:UPF0102 protein CTLFYP3_00581 n=1 Tax=Clostridium tertium TaxID=1559 RepID=A0A6N2Z5D5_9CLOT
MNSFNKDIGNYGEDLALKYLQKNDYEIISRNFRNRYGEIDLICKSNDLLVFIEVKSRFSYQYGNPLEAVTYFKQKQILKLCKFYIMKNKLYNFNCRFDVIEVYFNNNHNLYSINHIIDAFRGY